MTCAFYSIMYDIVFLIERKINYFIFIFYFTWQAACKSLCPCTGSVHADGAAEAWRAAGKACDATALPASHQQPPVLRHGCALLHDSCAQVALYFRVFFVRKNTKLFIAFKCLKGSLRICGSSIWIKSFLKYWIRNRKKMNVVPQTTALQIIRFQIGTQDDRVVYPHNIVAELDPAFYFDTYRSGSEFNYDADLDPVFLGSSWPSSK